MKKVERIISPPSPHYVGDGFRVHNFIPSMAGLSMERMSPFIMLDYNSKFKFPPSDQPKGVGVHPHRGFETVTIAYKGKVAHHDSYGNSGIIQEGDVQWMTAASGVLHKEYHEEGFSRVGGDFQMIQLWVNLPAKDKMSSPKYQNITNDLITKVPIEGGIIEVIAGSYRDQKGPATTFTPLFMYNAKLQQEADATFSFPAHYNTCLLVIEGSVQINNDQHVNTDCLVLMNNEDELFKIKATSDAVVFIISGEPINEPIAAHGPFVMNTQEEIMQAFEDYHDGKFGTLVN